MTVLTRAAWQLRAWRHLLWQAVSYPTRSAAERDATLAASRQLDASYLPSVRVDAFGAGLAEQHQVSLAALETRAHNCTAFELLSLGMIAAAVQPTQVFEIGTYDGRSALAMAMNAPGDVVVHTLNLPPDHVETTGDTSVDAGLSLKVTSGERLTGHPAGERVTQHFGDSRAFDFSPFSPCQLIFIDGAHDVESAMSDSENALSIIDRDNGVIAWHDATSYGVREVTRRLLARELPLALIAGTDLAVLRFRDGAPVPLQESHAASAA